MIHITATFHYKKLHDGSERNFFNEYDWEMSPQTLVKKLEFSVDPPLEVKKRISLA